MGVTAADSLSGPSVPLGPSPGGELAETAGATSGRGAAAERGRRSKAQRASARKAKVPPELRKGYLRVRRRLTKKTRVLYTDAVLAFKDWLRNQKGLSINSQDAGDAALSEYFDHLYFAGENPQLGRNTKYGLANEKGWQTRAGAMPLSRQSLQGWDKATRVSVRGAAPWEMAVVVAWSLCASSAPSRVAILSGFALLLLYDTYARGNEGLDILKPEVIKPTPGSRKYKYWAVVIRAWRLRRATKAGKYDDTVQVGSINPRRAWVQKLLASLYTRCSASAPLFDDLTLGQLEAQMRVGSKVLGVKDFWLTPHKLRHGAPSTDIHEKCTDTHGVADRGRWASEQSCRIYKQPGALLKLAALIKPAVLQLFDDLTRDDGDRIVREMRAALRTIPQPAGVARPAFEEVFSDDDLV